MTPPNSRSKTPSQPTTTNLKSVLADWCDIEMIYLPTALTNQQLGKEVTVGPERVGGPLETADPSIRAMLVKTHSEDGAVRVLGKKIRNVPTGMGRSGYVIVIIREGEGCMLLGKPSVRDFRCRH